MNGQQHSTTVALQREAECPEDTAERYDGDPFGEPTDTERAEMDAAMQRALALDADDEAAYERSRGPAVALCVACAAPVQPDGERFTCHACGLTWDTDGPPALPPAVLADALARCLCRSATDRNELARRALLWAPRLASLRCEGVRTPTFDGLFRQARADESWLAADARDALQAALIDLAAERFGVTS